MPGYNESSGPRFYGVVNSTARSSSCHTGWFKVLIQCLFGLITVSSFIMILILSMQRTDTEISLNINKVSKCRNVRCKMFCTGIVFEDSYIDIIEAVLELQEYCPSMSLELIQPIFENGTISRNWMLNLHAPVKHLSIINGNMKHVEPFAFSSGFFIRIETLTLLGVTLTTWTSESFSGLRNLKKVIIIDSKLISVEANVFKTQSNTLQTILIKNSMIKSPINLTGTYELNHIFEVNFSENNFHVISKDTFRQLKNCRILDLSSSKITAVELGAFDSLEHVEKILLNDNNIVALPSGIFDQLITNGPQQLKIHLHNNPWLCDCRLVELLDLNKKGVIVIDPRCAAPDDKAGQYFSSFRSFCHANESLEIEVEEVKYGPEHNDVIDMTNVCGPARSPLQIISPVRKRACSQAVAYTIRRDINKIRFSYELNTRNVNPVIFILDVGYTMLELMTSTKYGLVWFQSTCPHTVYCMDTMPQRMQLYNVSWNTSYVMCPIYRNGRIKDLSCMIYAANETFDLGITYIRLLFYILFLLSGVGFGAAALYGVIRKNPALLKGSKRVLLVKHKAADALVLPSDLSIDFGEPGERLMQEKYKEVGEQSMRNFQNVKRFSFRSAKSNSPSYVSALQPTEDQLKEWRLMHHFDNRSVISTISSSKRSRISCICDGNLIYSYHIKQTSEISKEI